MKDKEVMKLSLIKTDKNCYIKRGAGNGWALSSLFINGTSPVKTFDSYWFEIDSEPKTVQRKLPDEKVNHRMVLKAELLEGEGFSGTTLGGMRPEIPRDECMVQDDYEWCWNAKYKHLASLYELKYDTVIGELEDIDFECELYCSIPSLEDYSGMNYEVLGHWENSDPHRRITDRDIGRRAIDKIIYPGIMHPSCTAIMSSTDLYTIIRFHVKQNIDYRYADITSDYKFCFTVEKRLIDNKDYDPSAEKPTNPT